MSLGRALPFDDATLLAATVVEELAPTVELLKCVGSLRRKRPKVGDIEFIARPHGNGDLLGAIDSVQLDGVRAAMERLGEWVRGGPRMMMIRDLLGHGGPKLELFLVHPAGCICSDCQPHGAASWGSILAIRTGPADLSRYVVGRMRDRGLRHVHGQARRMGTEELVPTETEEDFFELAGVECRPPAARDEQAIELWSDYWRGPRR